MINLELGLALCLISSVCFFILWRMSENEIKEIKCELNNLKFPIARNYDYSPYHYCGASEVAAERFYKPCEVFILLKNGKELHVTISRPQFLSLSGSGEMLYNPDPVDGYTTFAINRSEISYAVVLSGQGEIKKTSEKIIIDRADHNSYVKESGI